MTRSRLTRRRFEQILSRAVARLNIQLYGGKKFANAKRFESQCRELLGQLLRGTRIRIHYDPSPQAFPDIVVGTLGVEVKYTTSDKWRAVGNSISEGSRAESVKHIYLLYGKLGGTPEVRWQRYEDCIVHVRTSHRLRFEVEIGTTAPLFSKERIALKYEQFRKLSDEEKMKHVRTYARKRLEGSGQRLWWLDADLPLVVTLWRKLSEEDQNRYRAEAALLHPSVVAPGTRDKYDSMLLYLLTYHGVLATRDAFSAGSAAGVSKGVGGDHVKLMLIRRQADMLAAAADLEENLFKVYWSWHKGSIPKRPKNRIRRWLIRADALASGWKPSRVLFRP